MSQEALQLLGAIIGFAIFISLYGLILWLNDRDAINSKRLKVRSLEMQAGNEISVLRTLVFGLEADIKLLPSEKQALQDYLLIRLHEFEVVYERAGSAFAELRVEMRELGGKYDASDLDKVASRYKQEVLGVAKKVSADVDELWVMVKEALPEVYRPKQISSG